MKITINRTELLEVMKDLKKLNSRHNIPILENIKLTAHENTITATYSDYQLTIVKTINGTIQENGSILLPFKKLETYARKLKDDFITLSLNTMTAGKKVFTFDAPDVINYPKLPAITTDGFSLFKDDFINLFKNITYSASKQESRPILTGVNIVVSQSQITGNATDSHRMAQKTIEVETGQDYTAVVPAKQLDKALKINIDNVLQVHNEEKTLVLKGETTTLFLKKLDGVYPDLNRLKQKQANAIVHLSKKELLEVIELAQLVSKESKNSAVKLISDNSSTRLETSNNTENFTSKLNSVHNGESFTIFFNPSYVLETLKNIDGEKIEFMFDSSVRPFVIGNEDNTYHLITPVRQR